ncbi:hypothetical protein ACJJTC_003716 [Scirpophaga incertulas]
MLQQSAGRAAVAAGGRRALVAAARRPGVAHADIFKSWGRSLKLTFPSIPGHLIFKFLSRLLSFHNITRKQIDVSCCCRPRGLLFAVAVSLPMLYDYELMKTHFVPSGDSELTARLSLLTSPSETPTQTIRGTFG